ncbi:protein of unknown function [Hyphomicrobium sp. MC1]|nr:protein of unknown function [Hyphomicrobium sp. MC1]
MRRINAVAEKTSFKKMAQSATRATICNSLTGKFAQVFIPRTVLSDSNKGSIWKKGSIKKDQWAVATHAIQSRRRGSS